MITAYQRDRIVRRRRCASKTVRTLKVLGLGLFLLLVGIGSLDIYSYTRTDGHGRVSAAVPATLNFQARLLQNSGAIVGDNNYSVEFNLYTAASGGVSVWSETHATVPVKSGYMSVYLGSVDNDLDTLDWSQAYWLTMNVNSDGEMNPRLRLTSVPYAFRSSQADSLTSGGSTLGADDLVQLAPSSIQAVNTALAALRLNQTGAGLLAQLQGNGSDVFTVSKTGAVTAYGAITFSNLASCDTIDTDANGSLTCGSDDSGTVTSVSLQNAYDDSTTPEITLDSVRGALTIRDSSTPLATNLFEIQSNNGLSSYFTVTAAGSSFSNDLNVGGGLQVGNTTNTNAGTIRWNGSDFQGYDGSGWVSLTGSGSGSLTINPTANKSKTADETQNNTVNASATLQNDDHLFFAIGANETWSFRFVITANAAATPDIKFAVTAPSGATCKFGVTDSEGAVAVGNLGCGVSSGLVTGNGTDDVYEVVGTVANGSTAGNVTLQWAQNTANAANTIVRTGSYLAADRISGGVQTADAFIQSGNSFGAAAVLGTNDNFGLSLLTNGSARLSILANGNIGIGDANPSALFSVGSGSPFQVNNLGVITATGLTSSGALSVTSGGASIIGGINNNSGGITNTGSITGIGTNITANAGLTITSGGTGALTLDSASGTLIIAATDTGLQRTAAGSYTIDLNDADATNLVLNNTGAGAANFNLNDGGLQTAGVTRLTNGGVLQNITGLSITSGGASISGNVTLGGSSVDRLTVTGQVLGTNALVFQGATDNAFTTTLSVADPTANNTIWLPNASGTLVLESRSILTAAGSGLSGGGSLSADRSLSLDIFGLTTKNAVNPTDYLAIYDDTSSSIKKISRSDLLQGLTGAIRYRGTWDASANNPALADNTGTEGDEYVVSVAGTQNLGSGNIIFGVGDFVIHNGTKWQLAPSSSQVSSVFGRTGAVVAGNGDYTASQITNTAAGGISSITIQAALNELDGEKLGSLNGLTGSSQTFANDTNVTINSSGSTHTLGWAGQLSVGRGGTGAASFTSNGILYGNNTGALQVTSAGTGGQVLLANATGVPTFTSLSGDITIDSSGVTTIGANKVALGTDTTNDYVQNLGSLTGLSTTGNSGEGSTPTLAVIYGSGSNTAVQGNTTLICPSGSGNLTGGGNTITLGSGGTCNNLSTANAVTFSTSVTTPLLSSNGGLSITSDATGDITLDSGTNTLIIDDTDTMLQRVAAGTYTINLQDAGTTTLALTNSGAGTASLTIDGGLMAAGGITFSNLISCNTIDTNSSGQLTCGSDEGGVGGSTSLQAAYDASTTPEITLDGTRGGLTIRDRATTPLGANLLEIQSNDGNTTYLAVTASGAAVTGTFTSSSTLTVSANGAVISGGIDNNSGGITEAGSITGVGTDITATAGLTIMSGGTGALTLDSASGTLVIAATDTGLQRTAAGSYTINLNDAGATTLVLENSGSGAASLNLSDGGLQVAGTAVLTNGRALQNLTGISTTGGLVFNSFSGSTGLLKVDASGNISLSTAGTDYEVPLSFGNGLSRIGASVTLGGTLSGLTTIALAGNNFAFTGTGNIGIGTAAPTAPLHIGRAADEQAAYPFDATTNGEGLLFRHYRVDTDSYRRYADIVALGAQDGVAGGSILRFLTNPENSDTAVERLRIDRNGFVGIGTTNPTAKLDVKDGALRLTNTTDNKLYEFAYDANDDTFYFDEFGVDRHFVIRNGGNIGFGTRFPDSKLHVVGGVCIESTDSGCVASSGDLIVKGLATLEGGLTLQTGDTFTFNGDALTDLTGTGLVLSSGALTIDATTSGTTVGTSSNSGLVTAADGLSMLRGCANNQILKWASAGSGAWSCATDATSDARLKKNIVSAEGGFLERIKAVRVVEFDFDCDHPAFDKIHCDSDHQTGVIAQELAQIFPELVTQVNGYYQVRYDALTLYNLKAVGELAAIISSNGDARLNNVSTGGLTRLSSNGALQNITGLSINSGGATISGGLNNNAGGITNTGSIQGATTINAQNLTLHATAGDNLLTLKKDNAGVFTILDNGALEMRVSADKAFVLKDAAGKDYFNINTNGGLVQIGSGMSDDKAVLLVLDSKNTAGDPAGVNGAQYYNEASHKFRCYQNNQWQDCLQAANAEYTLVPQQQTWNQPAADTEFFGLPRVWVDLTNAREFRMTMRLTSSGAAGADCRLQFATSDNGPWKNLDGRAGPELSLGAAGTLKTIWAEISPEAREEVLIRVMCKEGGSGARPEFYGIKMQIR